MIRKTLLALFVSISFSGLACGDSESCPDLGPSTVSSGVYVGTGTTLGSPSRDITVDIEVDREAKQMVLRYVDDQGRDIVETWQINEQD